MPRRWIVYPIIWKDAQWGWQLLGVKGEVISIDAPGTYAVRKVTDSLWKVDHVETGNCVATGGERGEAIDAAHELAATEGRAGFEKAIENARARVTDEARKQLGDRLPIGLR